MLGKERRLTLPAKLHMQKSQNTVHTRLEELVETIIYSQGIML